MDRYEELQRETAALLTQGRTKEKSERNRRKAWCRVRLVIIITLPRIVIYLSGNRSMILHVNSTRVRQTYY